MSEQNAVEVKPEAGKVAPAPSAVETSAKVETSATETTTPVESHTEKQDKKVTAAFIAQRRENRELKERLAKAIAAPSNTPPAPIEGEQAQPQTPQSIPAPVQETKTAYDIEEESVKAVHELAKDPIVASLPGAVIDIMQIVDTDKRLIRLHNIDPKLAFEEGKKMYLANAGMSSTPPPIPVPTSTSGGMGAGSTQDLVALYDELERHRAGTREWYQVAAKINAQLK